MDLCPITNYPKKGYVKPSPENTGNWGGEHTGWYSKAHAQEHTYAKTSNLGNHITLEV